MVKRLEIRLPDELHTRLVALAGRDHRTLNAQMVALLEEGVDHRTLTDPEQLRAITPEEVGALLSRALDREYRRQ
jgi:predicted transcriptional regulator